MSEHERNDDRPDPLLRAALRAHVPAPPFDYVDWNALHVHIMTRARPLLKRPAPQEAALDVASWRTVEEELAGSLSTTAQSVVASDANAADVLDQLLIAE